MGYQTKETVTGFNFVIPTFTAINGSGINIQDIKIADATDWSDSIQVLDEGGSTIATYFYATAAQSGLASDGWLSEDASSLANINLDPGQGILVDTAATTTITIPGVDL